MTSDALRPPQNVAHPIPFPSGYHSLNLFLSSPFPQIFISDSVFPAYSEYISQALVDECLKLVSGRFGASPRFTGV